MSEIELGGYREVGGYRIERNSDKRGSMYVLRNRMGDPIDSADTLAEALRAVADWLEEAG